MNLLYRQRTVILSTLIRAACSAITSRLNVVERGIPLPFAMIGLIQWSIVSGRYAYNGSKRSESNLWLMAVILASWMNNECAAAFLSSLLLFILRLVIFELVTRSDRARSLPMSTVIFVISGGNTIPKNSHYISIQRLINRSHTKRELVDKCFSYVKIA